MSKLERLEPSTRMRPVLGSKSRSSNATTCCNGYVNDIHHHFGAYSGLSRARQTHQSQCFARFKLSACHFASYRIRNAAHHKGRVFEHNRFGTLGVRKRDLHSSVKDMQHEEDDLVEHNVATKRRGCPAAWEGVARWIDLERPGIHYDAQIHSVQYTLYQMVKTKRSLLGLSHSSQGP